MSAYDYIRQKELYEHVFYEMCILLADNNTESHIGSFGFTQLNDGFGSKKVEPIEVSNLFFLHEKICFYQDNERNRKIIADYFVKLEKIRGGARRLYELAYKKKPKWIRDVEEPRIMVPGKKVKYTVTTEVDKKKFEGKMSDELRQNLHITKYFYQEYSVNSEYRITTNHKRKNVMSGILIPVKVGEKVKFSAHYRGCEEPEISVTVMNDRYLMLPSKYNSPEGKAAIQELKELYSLFLGK